MSFENALVVQRGQNAILLLEALKVFGIVFPRYFNCVMFHVFKIFAFIDNRMASLTNFFIDFVTFLEAVFGGDLSSEVDVLKGFEVFAGFSESFFDGGFGGGIGVSFVIQVFGFDEKFGSEGIFEFVSGFLRLHKGYLIITLQKYSDML